MDSRADFIWSPEGSGPGALRLKGGQGRVQPRVSWVAGPTRFHGLALADSTQKQSREGGCDVCLLALKEDQHVLSFKPEK